MKRLSLYIVPVLVGLVFFGATQTSAQKIMKKVTQAVEDIKWEPLKDAPPGVMTTIVRGEQGKGGYEGFNKFPAGFKALLHSHTYATKIVVIKGGYTYNGKIYGPGSYLYIPGGDKHISGGVADSETIFFIEQPGPFDLNLAEQATAKKQ